MRAAKGAVTAALSNAARPRTALIGPNQETLSYAEGLLTLGI